MLRHSVCKRCGNNGFHCNRIGRHGSLLNAACADIVKQEYAYFITAYQLIGAVRAFHCDAHTVCIRIRRKHQVRAGFLRQVQPLLQRLEDLRIRVAACGEIAVRIFLIRNNRDVRHTNVFQDLGHRHQTGAVERAVHQFQSCSPAEARTNLAGLDGIVKRTLAVLSDEADQSFLNALCERYVFRAVQHVRLLDLLVYDRRRIVRHLASVRPVRFISVVLRRVVGRRHHNARVAVIVACRK